MPLDLLDDEDAIDEQDAADELEGAAGPQGQAGPVGVGEMQGPSAALRAGPLPRFVDNPNVPTTFADSGGVLRANPGFSNEGRANFQEVPKDAWWIPKAAPPQDDWRAERDKRDAMAELLQKVPLKQAMEAIRAATELEGRLGFDADIKAGVPHMEALAKWGHKIYPKDARLQEHLGAVPKTPFQPSVQNVGGHELVQVGPNQFHVVPPPFTPTTVDVEGHKYVQVSPRSFTHMPEPGTKISPEDANTIKRLDQRESEIRRSMTPDAMAGMRPGEAEALKQKLAEIDRQRKAVYHPSAKPDISEARSEARALIQKHPTKADAIRKRFKEHYPGEDL